MKKVTVTGKTVDGAIEEALDRLNTTRDRVKVSVLEQPSKGFLGLIGVRHAKVEVEVLPTPVDEAVRFLEDVLSAMGLDEVQLAVEHRSDHVLINFKGNQLGILIGRRGQTLDSLQYLVNIVGNRSSGEYVRMVLDAEGYRDRRKETLRELADRIAKQVMRTKKRVTLEPMNPMERKVIHNQIQKYDPLTTFSEGNEPRRKVVIALKSGR
ncbi:RNA-binding cell elongation regulator Jag/EloR [Paludifilum halophilum]|uniref:RNA-binding protein KhpB n=1 Tax=Paludifilum halophilum TaxID=1642702 RepID=A0A235B7T7_9BACL|nr:RNA-binding cell elongation regulator Jag/EloR [Paludifilum halophilum]OYD07917.1 protein jag [Paludifilum halophilum]